MSSNELVERYLRALPTPPPELAIDLAQFERWGPAELAGVSLRDDDQQFLTLVGLPRDAAPFLTFRKVLPRRQKAPAGYLEVGFTGDGDVICVEASTGAVVHFNHDRSDEPVLVNSSLNALLESLCVYQEARKIGQHRHALKLVREIDAAVGEGAFWARETGG